MRLNFKKVSAIAASALMVGMTMGVAAAANYPNPFVVSGAADVAVVYGTGSGVSSLDLIQAGNIQTNLQSYMTGSTGGGASVSGEAIDLGTSGTRIYVNDSLNLVKSVLTKSHLPTLLADKSFSGNVDATITETIDIGSNPKVTFKKQPTSEDDPNYALAISTTKANYIYNTTATFSKAINFSHADSEGEDISLFGQTFTISSSTDTDTIVLLKSAEKVDLSSDSPTADVTIAEKAYTIELISASDTSATIKVTDSAGVSESKEINEAASKTVNDITVAVTTADETNLKLSATIVAGSSKITLEDDTNVKIGEDDTSIDGTLVDFETGNPNNLTALTISVYAQESDEDAIKTGTSFIDPVYGTFKLDFSGFNIASDSTSRETIKVTPTADDKMDITFTDHRGYTKTLMFAKDISGNTVADLRGSAALMSDDDNRNISVVEMQNLSYGDYAVVGNEEEGFLMKLSGVDNSSDSSSSNTQGDKVELTDIFSGETKKTTWTSDGVGTITIGGKQYGVYLMGDANNATEEFQVKLDYPDSSGNGVVVIYPTIETSQGAKVAFYEPVELQLNGHGMRTGVDLGGVGYNITEIKTPDGDGYESATIINQVDATTTEATTDLNATIWHITRDGSTGTLNTSSMVAQSMVWNVEGLRFNITNQNLTAENGLNKTIIYLLEPDRVGNINQSALIVWEEKDDNNAYEAAIILLENGRTSDDGLGVDTSGSGLTWHNNSANWRAARHSESQITDTADLWGTILSLDASTDTDQASAELNYPDEQIYTLLYMAENAAAISVAGASAATQLGDVLVKDSEVSSVSSKNLIVVGGSCINSAAAKLVGEAACSADFTTKTGIGSGQFLIQSFGDAYTTGKIALLVAGYEAADTVNAATYVRTQTVDTTAGKKYKGTSSTTAELVVA